MTILTLPDHPFHSSKQTQYQPTTSSPLSSSPTRPPLSPLNANTRVFSMSSPPRAKPIDWSLPPGPSTTRPLSKFAKRPTKSNPLMDRKSGGGDDGRETRRKLFLKRVRKDSEDKRWEERGGEEEIMRVVWMGEEKRRKERCAREADGLSVEEEEGYGNESIHAEINDNTAAIQEEAEIEAYLDMLEHDMQNQDSGKSHMRQLGDADFGSDEEDYDSLFMEVITKEAHSLPTQVDPHHPNDEDMMDLS